MAKMKISDLSEETIMEFCQQEQELEDIAASEGVTLSDEEREALEASIVESEEDEAAETVASDDEDNLDDDPTIHEDSNDDEDIDERGLAEEQRFFLRAAKQEAYLQEQEVIE